MRIALAHDSFTQLGGAERVMEALHELFPNAPIYTLVLDSKLKEKYKSWDIRTSWLQVLYNFIPKLQYLLPFIPMAVASLDFSGYDVVISSSSGFIKNIRVPKNCKNINYCHTPTRFLWNEPEYVDQEVPHILKFAVKPILRWMKSWDYKGAQRVTLFIANSKEVQNRIQKYYNRSSELVYPFIDSAFWYSTDEKKNYFLLSGRLQAHKNTEFVIQIFNELGLPLHIVGTGRYEKYLKSISKSNISFLGWLEDGALRDEYSSAKALLFPQTEDFGLVPLEAASCGTPTIAFAKGGALETVIDGQTGMFFKSYNPEELKKIIINFNAEQFKPYILSEQANKFNKQIFNTKILNLIQS